MSEKQSQAGHQKTGPVPVNPVRSWAAIILCVVAVLWLGYVTWHIKDGVTLLVTMMYILSPVAIILSLAVPVVWLVYVARPDAKGKVILLVTAVSLIWGGVGLWSGHMIEKIDSNVYYTVRIKNLLTYLEGRLEEERDVADVAKDLKRMNDGFHPSEARPDIDALISETIGRGVSIAKDVSSQENPYAGWQLDPDDPWSKVRYWDPQTGKWITKPRPPDFPVPPPPSLSKPALTPARREAP